MSKLCFPVEFPNNNKKTSKSYLHSAIPKILDYFFRSIRLPINSCENN